MERLDAAERQAKENGYMVLKYQKELDQARIQVLEQNRLVETFQRANAMWVKGFEAMMLANQIVDQIGEQS